MSRHLPLTRSTQHADKPLGKPHALQPQVGQPGLCRVLPVQRQIWELGSMTHIMGILNITPDSFSDAGANMQVCCGHRVRVGCLDHLIGHVMSVVR